MAEITALRKNKERGARQEGVVEVSLEKTMALLAMGMNVYNHVSGIATNGK